jgi:3-carboxy-cis,cis-muconate cycloisomerase
MGRSPEFDSGFSTPALSEIWTAASRVRRMCQAEAALASACARAGLVPESAARSIQRACATAIADPEALLDEGWTAGSPLIPLIARLREGLGVDDARFLHFGATSQDILDTVTVLQLRDSLGVLGLLLDEVAERLARLIEQHADDWVMARTLMQAALPIRFSVRVARWLNPIVKYIEDVVRAVNALPVQLGGPTGDLASYGPAAGAVVRAFADELHLAAPLVPWHTDRTVIVASVQLADGIASAAEAIAADLVLLSRAEIGEVRLPAGGSSAMPHKRNAIGAVHAIAAARACHGVSSIVVGAPPHELERAAGSWHAEWFAVPLCMQSAGAALRATRDALRATTFDAARARRNLDGAALPDPRGGDGLVERVLQRYRERPRPGT